MANAPLIWLTRPQEDSEALAAQLKQHGLESIIAPVMRIEPIAIKIPSPLAPAAILLTSRHACHALGSLPDTWRALPTYCVGTATATLARAAGCTNVIAGESDVLALLPQIVAALPKGAKLLYLAGEETRVDVAALLNAQQIETLKIICYRAIAATTLNDETIDALKNNRISGTALFSPRSAEIAQQLLRTHALTEQTAQIHAYCLSLPVAQAAGSLPWRTIRACHTPTLAAMVDLIVSCEAAVV